MAARMNAGETWNGRVSNVEYGMGTRAAGAMTLRAGAISISLRKNKTYLCVFVA
jgi:hypothetical protein